MMRTLTHEPLAFAFAALLLVAIVAAFTVWVTLRISKLRTDRVASATGAAGPDVPRAEASGPGRTRPSAMGEASSAGSSARPRPWLRSAKANGLAGPEAADMAPEGAPAALSGATPTCDCSAHPWLDGRHDVWCKADPIDEAIDLASALLIADDWKPTDRLDVGTEAEWWLAIGAPEGWAPPPVVPGRSES